MEIFEILEESLDLYFANQRALRHLGAKKRFSYEVEALKRAQESLKARILAISNLPAFTTITIPNPLKEKWIRYLGKKPMRLRPHRLNKKVLYH